MSSGGGVRDSGLGSAVVREPVQSQREAIIVSALC